ncbi:hypothetical protein EYF80_060190 [Liparis tanakae]|uniref:Uncharacterized protein n=1 Tax=Liparis tanakae TaxID=230148 RepID=A0A4Z2EM69_9TELE|nr:hypothetical protein EYF80_060190 [Liparis tanakae]
MTMISEPEGWDSPLRRISKQILKQDCMISQTDSLVRWAPTGDHFVAGGVRPHEAGVCDGVGHVLDGFRCGFMVGVCETERRRERFQNGLT